MPLDPNNAINELNRLLSSQDSEIKLHANGGNSILMVCKPIEEVKYIQRFNELSSDQFEIIDLNTVLVEFVDNNREDIEFYLENFKASVDQVFKNNNKENPDFFHLILEKIAVSYQQSKVPILINTGVIYATHFDMLSLMESKIIMEAALPTVFLYPAKLDHNKQLKYLNTRIASEYRCKIII